MENSLPDIFYFNPTCEYAVANGSPHWQPNKLLQIMERDLETLLIYLTDPKDVVLIRQLPHEAFLQSLNKLNITVPRFVEIDRMESNLSFLEEQKDRLIPWGWSPAVHNLFDPLKKSCSKEFKSSPIFNYRNEHKTICSRKFSIEILKKLIPVLSDNLPISKEIIPVVCRTKDQLTEEISKREASMVKAPWSSSGRGLQPIRKSVVHEKTWEKLFGVIKSQGYAIVEPLLNKMVDMALLFDVYKGEAAFYGVSRFQTNTMGQYLGNYLNGWPTDMESELVEMAEALPEIVVPPLIDIINNSILPQWYEGPLGIDMLIYKDVNNRLMVNPCLEINVKQTMGRLAGIVERLITPGKKGFFKVVNQQGISYSDYIQDLIDKKDSKFLNGRLDSGVFNLTCPFQNSSFGAYLEVY